MSRVINIALIICLVVIVALLVVRLLLDNVDPATEPVAVNTDVSNPADLSAVDDSASALSTMPAETIIAQHLTIPWEVVFLPDGSLLVTERTGTVRHIEPDTGAVTDIAIADVSHRGEGGLLGMTLHPNFSTNQFVHIYRTSSANGVSENSVVRYRFTGEALTDEEVIIDDIPGSIYHNGGRIKFGPDGYLYVATGDATDPSVAQQLDSLGGKILRFTADGAIPDDNPFGSAVYSYGHRNPQGLTWDPDGRLWSTEHGRSGARSGMDELNLIIAGSNYGWPEYEGDEISDGITLPMVHSGPDVTWAPGDALWWDGSVFFTGLRGETLYEAILSEPTPSGVVVEEIKEHFKGTYGRLRTITLGPDGAFYVLTSNRDGRGDVQSGDDKIIRLNPEQFR